MVCLLVTVALLSAQSDAWCSDGVVSTNAKDSSFCCPKACGIQWCCQSGCGEHGNGCCSSHSKGRICHNASDTGCKCPVDGCGGTPTAPTPAPAPTPAHDASAFAVIDDKHVVARVSPQFVSFNIDAFELMPGKGFDWNSSKLVALASHLSPALLRIGGSDQRNLKYDDDFFANQWPLLSNLARELKSVNIGTVFGLAPSVDKAAVLINHPDSDVISQWEFGNEPPQKDAEAGKKLGEQFVSVRHLLDKRFPPTGTSSRIPKRVPLVGPGKTIHSTNSRLLASVNRGGSRRKRLSDLAFPGWATVPSAGGNHGEYLRGFFEAAAGAVDGATMHIYPFDHNDVGGDDGLHGRATKPKRGALGDELEEGVALGDPLCASEAGPSRGWCNFTRAMWADPGELPDTHAMQEFALPFQAAAAQYANLTDVRVGETAAVNHGGWANVTDAVVSGFWSINQLGWLARMGYTVMHRQALACGPAYRGGKGAYGLLSVSPAFEPTPDYYVSVLWTRTMGAAVLNASLTVTVDGAPTLPYTLPPFGFATPAGHERTVRWFVHCAAEPAAAGGIAVAFANPHLFAINTSVSISASASGGRGDNRSGGGGGSLGVRHEYFLTSPHGDPAGLQSRRVALNNGAPLAATSSGDIPPMPPRVVDENPEVVQLLPLTYGFIVFPDAQASACSALSAREV